MKIEFTSLESEPLLYFLLHSGAFVLVMGGVFFLLGIAFGAAAWGRYRRQARLLREEGDVLREEIAGLKRKLAEQMVSRPGTGPLQSPPPALLTEVLPKVSEVFPERIVASSAPPDLSSPQPLVIPSMPVLPESLLSWPPESMEPSVMVKPKPKISALTSPPIPPRQDILEDHEVTPFSFLLQDEPVTQPTFDPAESTALSSMAASLSEIIAPTATAKTPEISPPPSVIPENDLALGLVFKERPADVDDLTRLQGVSPAIQNRLQELGIYRLQQVASWNQSQVREFSRRLAFKDRIERERWVEQARRLMLGEPI